MNTVFDFEDTKNRIVYVRPVKDGELPDSVTTTGPLYAVHTSDGARLAVVKGRNLAFALARQNDLAPVGVH